MDRGKSIMVQIPIAYPPVEENAIASYSYTDIAEATGVVEFLGFDSRKIGPGIDHHLTTAVFHSQNIEGSQSTYNFDLSPFNLPKTIKGTAIIRFSGAMDEVNGTTADFTIKVQRLNLDSSTTDLGTASVIQLLSTGIPLVQNFVLVIPLTEKHFKKGESLRINVTAAVSTGTIYMGHDPANRDGSFVTPASTYPTKFQAFIPFRIDI